MHQVWPSASSPHPSTLLAHVTKGRDQTVEHNKLAHVELLGSPFSSQCARTADSLTRSRVHQSSNRCAKGVLELAEPAFQPLRGDRPTYSDCMLAHTAYHALAHTGFSSLYGIQYKTVHNTIVYLDGPQIECGFPLSTLPSPFHVVGKTIWEAQPCEKRRQA